MDVMNYIKKMFNNLFRYRSISIYFLFSQIIMYITVFGGLAIFNQAYNKEQDRLTSYYSSTTHVSINYIGDKTVDYSDILSTKECNISIKNKIAASVAQLAGNYQIEIIITSNESQMYPLMNGRLPLANSNRREVAIGKAKEAYMQYNNEIPYITIDNENYDVVGIIGSDGSDYWDNKIVLSYGSIGDNLKKDIGIKSRLNMYIESNEYDTKKTYDNIFSLLQNQCGDSIMLQAKQINSRGESVIAKSLSKNNADINVIVYVFCLFNCIIMSELWYSQRKEEIVIRKAYGMNRMQIMRILLADILKLSLISFVMILIGYMIFNRNVFALYNFRIALMNIAAFALIMISVIICSIIIPFKNISKISINKAMKK